MSAGLLARSWTGVTLAEALRAWLDAADADPGAPESGAPAAPDPATVIGLLSSARGFRFARLAPDGTLAVVGEAPQGYLGTVFEARLFACVATAEEARELRWRHDHAGRGRAAALGLAAPADPARWRLVTHRGEASEPEDALRALLWGRFSQGPETADARDGTAVVTLTSAQTAPLVVPLDRPIAQGQTLALRLVQLLSRSPHDGNAVLQDTLIWGLEAVPAG